MKITALLFLLLTLVSCATPMHTPPFAVNAENAWFLEEDTSSKHAKPMYCMADVKEGKANPKCYRAQTVR